MAVKTAKSEIKRGFSTSEQPGINKFFTDTAAGGIATSFGRWSTLKEQNAPLMKKLFISRVDTVLILEAGMQRGGHEVVSLRKNSGKHDKVSIISLFADDDYTVSMSRIFSMPPDAMSL